MNKKPPKHEPERHTLDHYVLFPFKFQSLKPIACNSIKPRTLAVKTGLSEALSQGLAVWCSQSRPGSRTLSVKTCSDAVTQELALGRFHPRWLPDALNSDLVLGSFHSRPGSHTLSIQTWISYAFTQDLAPHVRNTSYNILILESLIMASITSLDTGPDSEYQPVRNNGEYIQTASRGGDL
jgi:hypothetical protein